MGAFVFLPITARPQERQPNYRTKKKQRRSFQRAGHHCATRQPGTALVRKVTQYIHPPVWAAWSAAEVKLNDACCYAGVVGSREQVASSDAVRSEVKEKTPGAAQSRQPLSISRIVRVLDERERSEFLKRRPACVGHSQGREMWIVDCIILHGMVFVR